MAIVAGMFAVSASVLLILKLAVTYITSDIAPFVVGGVLLAGLLYLLYSIALAQVKYEDKIKEITQK